MKKHSWIWIVFAVLVVLAMIYPFLTKNSPLKAQPMFQQLDFNGDGLASQAEFAAHRTKLMSSLDKSGDGKLSADEFAVFFSRFDLDRDGVVTQEEFLVFFVGPDNLSTDDLAGLRAFYGNYPDGFVVIDSNKDGSLSISEFKASRLAAFKDLDKDKDGQLSRDEVQAGAAKWHKYLDRDKDSGLNIEEFSVGAVKLPPPPPAKPAAAPAGSPAAVPAQK